MHPWMNHFRCANVKLEREVSYVTTSQRQDILGIDEAPDETAQC